MDPPKNDIAIMDVLWYLMNCERSKLMSYCEYCGAKLIDGSKFCVSCGQQVVPAFDTKNLVSGETVKKAMNGNADAFQELYEKTYRSNLYVARKYMKEDASAEDVLQDAYIKIWNNLPTLKQPEGFVNWARRIVANTALNELRKRTPLLFGDLSDENSDGAEMEFEVEDTYVPNNPEVSFTENEEKEIISEMINSLSDEQRMCVLMYYIEEMSVKEIAEIVGCSEGTVKSRLNYGRKNIKEKAEALQKKGYVFGSLSALALFIFIFRRGTENAATNASVIIPPAKALAPATVTAQPVVPKTQTPSMPADKPVPPAPQGSAPVPQGSTPGFLAGLDKILLIPIIATVIIVGAIIAVLIHDTKDDEPRHSRRESTTEATEEATTEMAEATTDADSVVADTDDETAEESTEEAVDENENSEETEETADNAEYGDASCIYGYKWFSKYEMNVVSSETVEAGDENMPDQTSYKYDVTDTGSGYEIVGKLTVPNRIAADDYNRDACQTVGYSFTNYGKTYTVTAYELNEQGRGTCTMQGDDGKTYKINNDISFSMDELGDDPFFDIYCVDDDSTTFVIENVKIFIPYGSNYEYGIAAMCNGGGNGGTASMEIMGIKLDENGEFADNIDPIADVVNLGSSY